MCLCCQEFRQNYSNIALLKVDADEDEVCMYSYIILRLIPRLYVEVSLTSQLILHSLTTYQALIKPVQVYRFHWHSSSSTTGAVAGRWFRGPASNRTISEIHINPVFLGWVRGGGG